MEQNQPKPTDRLFFIIPAYNESENLPYLLTNLVRIGRFLDLTPIIIVVNDGSTDNTLSVLCECRHQMNLLVLNHETNLGPGVAFRTGFARLLQEVRDEDIVVTIEADNTSDLCVLCKMIEQIDRGNDVVLASVYGDGHIVGSTIWRRTLSLGANALMKIVFRIPHVNTFTSFFRMYRSSALRKLFATYGDETIHESGFTCMVEMLVKFHLIGVKISQVPMLLDSRVRLGHSKMRIVQNTQATLAFICRYLFSRAYRPPPIPALLERSVY